MTRSRLTPKRRRFVEEYPACGFNGTEAARRAGYARPRVEARRLLTNADIQTALAETLEPILARARTDADRVFSELTAIGFASILHVASWDGEGRLEVKPSDELPPVVASTIKKIKQNRRIRVLKDGTQVETIETEIELHDKLAALRLLARATELVEKQQNPVLLQVLQLVNELPRATVLEVAEGGPESFRQLLEDAGYTISAR